MADFKTAATIGARIAAARKARGFKAAKDLADAVPNDTITESILQNIEAGRKSDLTISQLINIAWALQISPMFLLAPLGSPASRLDLPNLTEEVARLSSGEFDAWVSGLNAGDYLPRLVDERNERLQLESLRMLLQDRRELHRLRTIRDIESKSLPSDQDAVVQKGITAKRIAFAAERVAELEEYLASGGWDIGEA